MTAPYTRRRELENIFSLDIETGGLDKRTAPVLSIGVVYGNLITRNIKAEFYVRINLESQPTRHWDSSTKEWWEKTAETWPESYKEVTATDLNRLDLSDAIEALQSWMEQCHPSKVKSVFGKGPEFDNEFIDVLTTELNKPLPWKFRDNQSHRTLEWLDSTVAIEPIMSAYDSVSHHALEDARVEFYESSDRIRNVVNPVLLPPIVPEVNVTLTEPHL